ncbi:MAG TPA: hypothetical protein VGU74_15840 [Gemmatimonadales bacterium]|nr:hypothetical protein [Gemmatimonadales bacterium]
MPAYVLFGTQRYRRVWVFAGASERDSLRASPSRAGGEAALFPHPVVAAVAGLPLIIATVRATAPKARLHSWHGEVLGALSELTLWPPNAVFARRTILRVRHEIERFERIFSLYRPDSEISRLNEADKLTKAVARAAQTGQGEPTSR